MQEFLCFHACYVGRGLKAVLQVGQPRGNLTRSTPAFKSYIMHCGVQAATAFPRNAHEFLKSYIGSSLRLRHYLLGALFLGTDVGLP